MQALDDYIFVRRGAHDALVRLFYETDAEIITSADRRAAGLPERNERGLSPDEHKAIEAQRALLLVAPPAHCVCVQSAEAESKSQDKRPRLYQWREFLTAEEAQRIGVLSKRARPTPAQRYEMQLIRNRAIQRARYEAKKR